MLHNWSLCQLYLKNKSEIKKEQPNRKNSKKYGQFTGKRKANAS